MEQPNNSILTAMSGGVDSSVAALILKNEGYDVRGIIFRLHDEGMTAADLANGKLPQSIWHAREAARRMRLDFSIYDVREAFCRDVIGFFVTECGELQFPDPCIFCDRSFKLPLLLSEADRMDCPKVASGHYAVTQYDPELGRYVIRKGVDTQNDQSHRLYRLTQEQLSRLVTPLGNYKKEEVRQLAREARLKNAERPETPKVCFIQNRQYKAFLEGKVPDEALQKMADPMDVPEFRSSRILADRIHFAALEHMPKEGMPVAARIRRPVNETEGFARIREDGLLEIELDEELAAAAPGQHIVLYDGDTVLLGGIITTV